MGAKCSQECCAGDADGTNLKLGAASTATDERDAWQGPQIEEVGVGDVRGGGRVRGI